MMEDYSRSGKNRAHPEHDAARGRFRIFKVNAARLGAVLKKLDWRLIGMMLIVKSVFYLYGTQAYQALTDSGVRNFTGWLALWNRWDAIHFLNVAQNGYQAAGNSRFEIVNYPLFPWLTRVVALAVGNYVIGGLIVAGLASIAAGLLLQKLVLLDYSRAIARRAVWFMFIFPTSYVLHVPYSESVLIALALGSFLAARNGRWPLAGVLGALACLSRLNGLVLAPSLLIEAGCQWRIDRRFRWSWLWIGFTGLGIVAYLLLNYHVSGDPFIFMKYAREHWNQVLSWPWIGISEKITGAFQPAGSNDQSWLMIEVQGLIFIALGFVGSVWAWIKLRPSYAMWMTGNWLLFTSTTFLISVPRFTVVMFPLYMMFSRLSGNRLLYGLITVWSLLYLALFTGLYVEGHWVS